LAAEGSATNPGTLAAHPFTNQYRFVVDDLTDKELGEYDISLRRKRRGSSFFLGRNEQDLTQEIVGLANKISPLVNYLPASTFQLLVESAERRQIMPRFIPLFVLFVNLIGWSNRAEQVAADRVGDIVEGLAEVCARIDAIVQSCGGVLKSLTYHRYSDILIYFGYPNGHVDDASRAARVADEIRHLVLSLDPRDLDGQSVKLQCQIGMAWGAVFVAEIGEPLGRRELNILGDAVNVAARLMARAKPGQVLMTTAVHEAIARETSDRNSTITITSQPLGDFQLKGKVKRISVVELQSVEKW
jgi:class 3 adenylate cyclase